MPVPAAYTDEQLLQLLIDDDPAAFTEIYHRYYKELYLIAWNGLRDQAIAEDVIQEIFVSLWQRRSEVRIEALKPWLLQAARFQVLKAFRRGKADGQFLERLARVSAIIEESDPAVLKELQTLIPALLHSLPPDQQRIFRMHREEHLTYREIAERLGISVKTVEKKMSLALSQLRLGLKENILLLATIYCCA